MNEYMSKQTGRECPPPADNPAPQPQPPGDGTGCYPLSETTPPKLEPPAPCPTPDPCCKCPTKPETTPSCLEDLVAQQTADIVAIEQANLLKDDLKKILSNANRSHDAYKRKVYEEHVERWRKQDADIADLLRNLECVVRCWRCVLDCYVCPVLNDLHKAEKWLYDDGKLITEVHTLHDLKHWRERDLAAKKRRFDRIASVMKVWGADPKEWVNPADKIKGVLDSNAPLIAKGLNEIGNREKQKEIIYDVFLTLVPRHLAIAPPATTGPKTKIEKKYTEFCECDTGTPDDCCGPDVGEWSLRQRLIGPQPYLIDPNDYFKLICCLVEKRYTPAKDAYSKAETELTAVTGRIQSYEKKLGEEWDKQFERAKNAIPSVIDCCDYERDAEHTHRPSRTH